ncbi:opioid growth factor receptor-related protein [Rudaea sp.]|uniref:opioid growth factor receptor-related protein n=1 Tax=Rudaea sp. TaxID=2136325 RepID=UPI002ED11FF5
MTSAESIFDSTCQASAPFYVCDETTITWGLVLSYGSNEASASIFAFYRDDQPDSRGRRLADILERNDEWLEHTHDYVPFVFPLPEPSGSNRDAPPLDNETIAAFRASEVMRDRLRSAYLRMLRFYGLRERTWHVEKGENWDDRKAKWATVPMHYNIRITRILRSMCLLGLRSEAEAFKGCLIRLAQLDRHCDFDKRALANWHEATAEV